MDLYINPVLYGVEDVTLPGERPAWVIYPSEDGAVWEAPIRPGTYPLIVFVHGSRNANDGVLCPPDISQDYQAWLPVLHLLARCGFVVLAPSMHDVLFSAGSGADAIEDAVHWMHFQWPQRAVLWRPGVFESPMMYREQEEAKSTEVRDLSALGMRFLGEGIGVRPDFPGLMTTSLGLVGHSWGMRVCAQVAGRGKLGVKAIACIAGAFDDNEAIAAFVNAQDPTLMIAGTEDLQNASYLAGLWNSLPAPKYQALLQGIGHWDWFGGNHGIQPCDSSAERPECPVGWLTAAELVLGFMAKRLFNMWYLPPHLLGPAGDRTPLMPYYEDGAGCALKVRWNDPQIHQNTVGDTTFGEWESSFDPW